MGYNLYQGNCLLPSQIQILQGLPAGSVADAALASLLAGRSTAITTTTTTTITTATNTGNSGGNSGFGSNFGFSDGGFGGFSGFGGNNNSGSSSSSTSSGSASGSFNSSGSSSGSSTSSGSTSSSSTSSTSSFGGSNSGFGFGTDSGFGSDFGFGGDNSGFGGSGSNSGSSQSSTTSSNSGSSQNSQQTTPTSPNPALNQKLPNCAVADQTIVGKCITCSIGYLSNGMACIYISPLCASYSLAGNGSCLSCKFSLNLVNGFCVDGNCQTLANNVCTKCVTGFALNSDQICKFSDSNCLAPLDFRCGQCSTGYFVTTSGFCQALPPKCAAADMQSYACLQCIQGFVFDSNKNCVQQLPQNCQTANSNNPSLCMVCLTGFNAVNGICQRTQPIVPNCQAYDLASGICMACATNFTLTNGLCVAIPLNGGSGGVIVINGGGSNNGNGNTNSNGSSSSSSVNIVANRDSNCIMYSGSVCTSCSSRYYFGPNGLCVPVNPLCKDYFSNGSCSSCYPSYVVSGTTCIVNGRVSDPNCKSFSQGGACDGCFNGFFFNQVVQLCQALNPICKTSNLTDGTCLSCYGGYSISAGKCSGASQDANCQKFASGSTTCVQCSSNFYLNTDGRCKQISPLCKTASQSTGACLSCYAGYVLQGTNCVVGGAATLDANCATFNNNICINCSSNYYLNTQGVCITFNPLCKTSNTSNGACLSCFKGYGIQSGTCVIVSGQTSNSDVNCKATDANGACTACYSFYYLSVQGNCIRLDTNCKTYTFIMSQCASCYDGYSLSSGQCVVSSLVPNSNADIYCIKTQGSTCIACSSGYYLAPTGICNQLNPLCKTSDMTTGGCTDCYGGYTLSGSTCIVAAAVNIPYCQTVVGLSCTLCISGFYVSNGGCALANTLCATYDPNSGACWSCLSSYVFQNGTCILPSLGIDPFCQYYTNSFCSQCVPGYALVSYVCNMIDVSCTQFDNVQNVCKTCSGGKIPQGPSCV